MQNRNKVLQDKAQELEISLARWAKKAKILEPGEQIEFTMKVKEVSIVHGHVETEEAENDLVVNPKTWITMGEKKRNCEFVCPLKLTQPELHSFLMHFRYDERKFLEFLLIKHGNEPIFKNAVYNSPVVGLNEFFSVNRFAEKLAAMEIHSKRYRLAKGVGVFHKMVQLWEVRPKTA